MNLKKMKGAYYLMLKLNGEGLRYLQDFSKCESKANNKSAIRFLEKALALNIRSLYFMNYAKLLQADGRIKKKAVQPMIRELDKTLNYYSNTLDGYITRLRKWDKK
jgi:ribosomal protein S17E